MFFFTYPSDRDYFLTFILLDFYRYGSDSRTQLFSNVPAYNPNKSYPNSAGGSRTGTPTLGTPVFGGASSVSSMGLNNGVTSRNNNSNGNSGLNPYNYNSNIGTSRTNSPYMNDSVMDSLESQNDRHIEGLTAKVQMLKDITIKIGDEVRDSNKLLQDLESNFDGARTKLKVTFNRMKIMAERSGVSWRVWLMFFAMIFLVFFYVWWR